MFLGATLTGTGTATAALTWTGGGPSSVAEAGVAVPVRQVAVPVRQVAVPVRQVAVPVEPDRDQARGWAAEELSRREYQAARPGMLQRLVTWLRDRLENVMLPSWRGTRLVSGIVLAGAVGLVAYAVIRGGGLRRQVTGTREALYSGRPLSAAEHRAAAETAARVEDWPTCIVERFRAVARELEERAVLTPQPGRTADEVAREAGSWLPDLADRLCQAARRFDDVRYGDRPGSAQGARELRELDDSVCRARPAAVAQTVGSPVVPS